MIAVSVCTTGVLAVNPLVNKSVYEGEIIRDTLYTELKNDIVILSTTKETNSLKSLPAAVTVFSQKNLDAFQVSSLKDLSSFVPNYFAANYGSKMTAPLYIRGVGARSGTQTVSMYVDNIPYFNTTSFDTELFDIQRVEVLRGTQGTLYGRNAMGGIMNIYTYSPLDYEGTTAKVGGGSYGLFQANASHYKRINDDMGFSVSGYYKRHDGYHRNNYTGKEVDFMDNTGLRAKYVWNIQPNLSMNYSTSFDYLDQGAFPYEDIETREINSNSEGFYKRKLFTNGLSFKYKGEGYEINSTSGYQYLNDDMGMDIDYTPKSYYEINQRQKQNSASQEFTVKSTNNSNYQWSNGVFGFYDYLHTDSPVYMMEDGVKEHILGNIPLPGTFNRDTLDLESRFKNMTYGAAIFHQSTYNNLFVQGLSATVGLRLDYEKTRLHYKSHVEDVTLTMNVPGRPPMPFAGDTAVVGSVSHDFLEILPRFVLKYEVNKDTHFYGSASKGYKTGGHNIQVFADILQGALMAKLNPRNKPQSIDVNEVITYQPEYSWNYEVGGQASLIKDHLTANFALFYVDIQDVQLTKFVQTMGGRMVVNGGKARSMGFELGLKARPCKGFFLYANYGFADAEFKDYLTSEKGDDGKEIEIDYSGNKIPFAPRSTFSVGGTVEVDMKNKCFLDKITFDSNFTGVGKIYWHEDNAMSQGFYGALNAKVQFQKGIFTVEAWGRNILDRDYRTFVFDSGKKDNLRYYGQRGLPATFGGALKITL